MVLIEIVYCKITGKTRDLPKIHHFIPLEPWEAKKIKGKKKRMKSVVEMTNDSGPSLKATNNKQQIKLVLDMSNEGPMFKMIESMLGGAGTSQGLEALKKLLKSGIPGLEGFLSGGVDGFAKMSDEDKKRFLAAVTGVGGKIDGKAAAALIAAAASGGDPEIANKIIEKMMSGLGDEIDPAMMAALMATTVLVAKGASNEEILAAMRRELANSGLSEEEIFVKTMLLQKALAGDNSPAFVNKTLKSAMTAANITSEDLAKVLIAEKAMAKAGASPTMLAKALQLHKALSERGVSPELIAEAMSDLLSEAGISQIPDLKGLLQSGITAEDVAKIIALSKSISSKEPIDIPPSVDSKEAVKAVLKKAFNNDLEQFAKTVMAQKAMTASGASPENVAKVAFLTRSMADNGMSTSEIANALTMAINLPDGKCSKEFMAEIENLIQGALKDGKGLSDEDIKMLMAFSEAFANPDGLIPPEAVRLFKKAMKQRRGSVDNVAETLMSSLTASGESKENVARAMIKALKATGASAEEIAKTMQQAMEKAGASPEEMAKVLAQALAESGATPQEIAKVLKATFAKAMASNPAMAAEIARSMAEALALAGASSDEIADTLQCALQTSLQNVNGDNIDELLDIADTVARSMAEAGASPMEIAAAMKAAFAAAAKSDDPFVAEELAISMAKALANAGATSEQIMLALQESLKATGASKEDIARTLLTALATSGIDPEEMAKTMQALLLDSGLTEEEIKEKILQSMIEAGATPEAIAKVMVHQELLNTIGKSAEELSKQLLKQLRSGNEITLQDLATLLKSGGISVEEAGKAILFQKALSVLKISPHEIARAILLQKSLFDQGTPTDEIIDMINMALQESGIDITKIDIEKLTTADLTVEEIMNALNFDKVLEAGGVTLEGLRQDNASKKSVSDAVKEMLHSSGATPEGLAGALLIQKIMTSLNISPDIVAKLIVLEKSLYDSGTSPQDILHLLQMIATKQKVDLVASEPQILKAMVNSVNSKDIEAVCDLINAFHGARVAPELTSKLILLQKAIESGISSPESTVKDLSEQLKKDGVNPAEFVTLFNEVLKKNGIDSGDISKAVFIQKAAAGVAIDPLAISVLMDIQNSLLASGLSEEDVTKVLRELVKGADFAQISKSMMSALEGNQRLQTEDIIMGGKIADAIDRSAGGNSKLAKLLAKENLKGKSPEELVSLLSKVLADTKSPNGEALAKVIALQAFMANSNSDPGKLARAMRVCNGMVKNGVTSSTISRLIHEVMDDSPAIRKQALDDVKKSLKELPNLISDPKLVSFLQKYQTAMTEACSTIDNLKEIFENAMAVVGLTKEDVAKAAMVQKTLSASGVTPEVLAQAVLFQRALSASGLTPEEILGVLSKVTSPKFSEEEISVLLAKVLERKSVSKEDIEAISKIQKALRNGNFGFGSGESANITEELQHLIAKGEVDMEILGKAVLMQKILSASGLSPVDLGKAILLQQGMLDAGATPEGIANCMHKALMESDMSLDQIVALMQLGLMQSSILSADDIRNTLMFDKVLGAAQAAKIIAKKISPEQMKLLEASVNAAKEGGSGALINAMKKALGSIIDPVSLQAMEVSAVMAQAGATKEEIEEMMALILSQGTAVSPDFLVAVKEAMKCGGSPAERLAALKGAIDEELNSVQANLRNTFMNKIPSAEDIKQACSVFASRFMMNEESKNECKLALVDLLDEALQDVTMYEPDADMIFNYLMVSALANASDIIEKKNLKATGDLLENLALDYMISMLERLFNEADLDSSQLILGLKQAKSLAELQEALRALMDDPKLAAAFKRQVAFLFDFEEIEHTTVAGLAMQDILKDAKHRLRPWELNKHRKVRGLRRAQVPQLTYSQVYCFYKVLPKHQDGPTIGFDYE